MAALHLCRVSAIVATPQSGTECAALGHRALRGRGRVLCFGRAGGRQRALMDSSETPVPATSSIRVIAAGQIGYTGGSDIRACGPPSHPLAGADTMLLGLLHRIKHAVRRCTQALGQRLAA